jgi:hypothetical protein
MANPNEDHWKAMKRVLRYLRQTSHYKLRLSCGSSPCVVGYCDADWGSDHSDRRSVTGISFFVDDSLVSWISRRQTTVALSSTEAEYLSLSDAVKEAIWLKGMLAELTGKEQSAVTIYGDNQGCLKLAETDSYHSRTKHIDIRAHFLREVIERGDVALEYVRTEDMTADVMTKGLNEIAHNRHCEGLGIIGVNDPGKNARRQR